MSHRDQEEGEADDAAEEAGRALAKRARLRETIAAQDELRRLMLIARPDNPFEILGRWAWKGFLAIGGMGLLFLLSTSFTDPTNFRHGVRILAAGALKLFTLGIITLAGLSLHARLTASGRQRMEKGILLSLAGCLALFVLYLLGFFHEYHWRVWKNGFFVATIAAQICALIFLFRQWKALRIKFREQEAHYIWQKPLSYVQEGLLLYLVLGIFLQAFMHVNVPAIVMLGFTNPIAGGALFFPLCAYVLLRKMVSPG